MSFSHPILHVINADTQYVMWSEVFAENAWLGDSAIFVREVGGIRSADTTTTCWRYQVVRQQHGGHHYYVWARRLEDAEAIAEWIAGGAGCPPWTMTPRLRITDDFVKTSFGANIPLDEAKRLWPVIQRTMNGDRDYEVGMALGNYRLTKIRRDGSIVVGCHDIPYSEIERIAGLLGLLEEATA